MRDDIVVLVDTAGTLRLAVYSSSNLHFTWNLHAIAISHESLVTESCTLVKIWENKLNALLHVIVM